jgi:hypothetical protein
VSEAPLCRLSLDWWTGRLRVCVRDYMCVAWISEEGERGGRVGVRDAAAGSVFVLELI